MITGRSSGSGKYAYHERSSGNRSVQVSHMPDDGYRFRVAIRHNGEIVYPVLLSSECEAELLWAALNAMAKDMGWEDKI